MNVRDENIWISFVFLTKKKKVILCLQFGAIRKFFHIFFYLLWIQFLTHFSCLSFYYEQFFAHILSIRSTFCIEGWKHKMQTERKQGKQPFGQLKIKRWIKREKKPKWKATQSHWFSVFFFSANFIDNWHMLFHWTRHFNHTHCNFIRFPLFYSHDSIIIITFWDCFFLYTFAESAEKKNIYTKHLFEVWAKY